jgi:hypothetical protein
MAKGKIAEGKRIAKGELLASLRAEILRNLKRTWDSASLHGDLYAEALEKLS